MTNEEYIKAIDLRRSRRTFKPVLPDKATLDVIESLTGIVNKVDGLEFRFIEDASFAFTFFTGRFSAIAICGDDSEWVRVKAGYYGESIVLECAYHGLGTCWVAGTYNENKMLEYLKLPQETRLYCVIVIGLVKPKLSKKEQMMYNVTHKKNKPYQKMFEVCDEKLPPHFEYAMKLVEKAPSSVNRRPVRFRYENGEISAYVDEPYSDKSIDFGIAQLHFNIGCASMGVVGEWDKNGKFIPRESKIVQFPKIEETGEDEKND